MPDTPRGSAAIDPLVWQSYGGHLKVPPREDCRFRSRSGGVTWRRSFAAADYEHGLGLQPCKRCRPDQDEPPVPEAGAPSTDLAAADNRQ